MKMLSTMTTEILTTNAGVLFALLFVLIGLACCISAARFVEWRRKRQANSSETGS
jgi:hypothetical protein